MWGVRCSVVRAKYLTECRFDHNVTIDEADIVVVYNDCEVGHYSAVCKFQKTVHDVAHDAYLICHDAHIIFLRCSAHGPALETAASGSTEKVQGLQSITC